MDAGTSGGQNSGTPAQPQLPPALQLAPPRFWAPQEDAVLLRHVLLHGTRHWATLQASGALPYRDARSCCNRYRFLRGKFLQALHSASGASLPLYGGFSHEESLRVFSASPSSGASSSSPSPGQSPASHPGTPAAVTPVSGGRSTVQGPLVSAPGLGGEGPGSVLGKRKAEEGAGAGQGGEGEEQDGERKAKRHEESPSQRVATAPPIGSQAVGSIGSILGYRSPVPQHTLLGPLGQEPVLPSELAAAAFRDPPSGPPVADPPLAAPTSTPTAAQTAQEPPWVPTALAQYTAAPTDGFGQQQGVPVVEQQAAGVGGRAATGALAPHPLGGYPYRPRSRSFGGEHGLSLPQPLPAQTLGASRPSLPRPPNVGASGTAHAMHSSHSLPPHGTHGLFSGPTGGPGGWQGPLLAEAGAGRQGLQLDPGLGETALAQAWRAHQQQQQQLQLLYPDPRIGQLLPPVVSSQHSLGIPPGLSPPQVLQSPPLVAPTSPYSFPIPRPFSPTPAPSLDAPLTAAARRRRALLYGSLPLDHGSLFLDSHGGLLGLSPTSNLDVQPQRHGFGGVGEPRASAGVPPRPVSLASQLAPAEGPVAMGLPSLGPGHPGLPVPYAVDPSAPQQGPPGSPQGLWEQLPTEEQGQPGQGLTQRQGESPSRDRTLSGENPLTGEETERVRNIFRRHLDGAS